HLGDPHCGVVAAAADLLEAHPALHVLGFEPGARVHPEVDRVGDALDDPGVTLFEVLDAGGAVAQPRGDAARPQVGRLVDVAVGRDQSVLALDGHAPKGTHAPPSVESRRDRERAVTRPAGAPSTYVISLTP